jgi:hypothetical protein
MKKIIENAKIEVLDDFVYIVFYTFVDGKKMKNEISFGKESKFYKDFLDLIVE